MTTPALREKKLLLIRHAHAEFSNVHGDFADDITRALDARGHAECRAVFQTLKDLPWVSPWITQAKILSSPALRTEETAKHLTQHLALNFASIEWSRSLYLAGAMELLKLIQRTEEPVQSLVLIAHQPGLEELCLHLTGSPEKAHRLGFQGGYPTCHCAFFTLNVDLWCMVDHGCARSYQGISPSKLV